MKLPWPTSCKSRCNFHSYFSLALFPENQKIPVAALVDMWVSENRPTGPLFYFRQLAKNFAQA